MDSPIQGPVFLIESDKIAPNPHQPRRNFDNESLRELAASIREFGILQPILVSKHEKETETGTDVEYQLIAGERRWLAAKLVGLERVPAIIKSVELDKERLELAIVENIQRTDLSPIEAARAYAKLQDQFRLTQREIASRIGKSREVVANAVRLLSLPLNMQDAVGKGVVSESQARMLLMVADMAQQQSLFDELIQSNMSVRELHSRIRRIKGESVAPEEAKNAGVAADPETIDAERELEEVLGARVKVERSGPAGKITITFHSPEEFYGIVSKIREKYPVPEHKPSEQSEPNELHTPIVPQESREPHEPHATQFT